MRSTQRKWNIDPSKPLQHDIHNLMLLVKRANEMAKTVLPEASILGMLYDAISKDPREELRMLFIIYWTIIGRIYNYST